MPSSRPRGFRLALLIVAFAAAASAQQPLPPDQQAETILTAGTKAYNDGNLPAAAEQFKQVLQKFPNTPQANAAKYGIGLVILNSPEQNYAAAAEQFAGPANDGGFRERASAIYFLGVCKRALGLKELEQGVAKPNDMPQRKQAADQKFNEAAQSFQQAMDFFGANQRDKSGRARCDLAEMLLRLGKVKDARNACEPFTRDPVFADNAARSLGLYFHGFACFLDRDYPAAGRSLNQTAPFNQPGFGTHARYLVGRVLHLNGENAEASVQYDAVLADYEKAKAAATEALKNPDKLKSDPAEKARLEALAKGPPPEYVAGAAFHGACLNYEAGRFAEALGKLQAFAKDYPQSPLLPDAQLRAGLCLVQMRQFDDAAKLLAPMADKTPRLADQILLWLGKAQLGIAATADPNNQADRDAKTKTAIATLKQAADRAQQLAGQDPDAKPRRAETLFEYADALQVAKQFKEAAGVYEQLWGEQALPGRKEELLQRMVTALGAAGELERSSQRRDEFLRTFPQSTLTPAVLFRSAENAYAKSVDAAKRKAPAEEQRRTLDEAAGKYKLVAERYAEFDRVNYARLGMAVCYAQLGVLEEAVKALEAIPSPERAGELAAASYLLADCLIRQAPTRADDALAENQIREKLTAAADLLAGFAAGNPKSPDAPAALLKLGLCQKRLGATLADANERNQTLNKAREVYEKLVKEYPQSPLAAQARMEQAKVKAMAGDRGGATDDLRKFVNDGNLRQTPVAPLAYLHLATLLREQNQPAEAVKVLADARQKYESQLAGDPERAEWGQLLKYHHGIALFEDQKPKDAVPLFEEVIKESAAKPLSAEAALRAGQCKIAEGKKEIDAGLNLRNSGDKAKVAAGSKMIYEGRSKISHAAYELARRAEHTKHLMPTGEARGRIYYEAAWAFRELAVEDIAKALEEMRKQGKAADRIKIAMQAHEEQALNCYKKLIEDYSDTAMGVDARFELAELQIERGEIDEAVKLLKDALDKEPADRPVPPDTLERIRLRLGAALAAKKDYAGAVSQFEAVAGNAKSPYLAQALYRAGDCQLSAGEADKAIDTLKVFRDKNEFHNTNGISDRAMIRLGQALLAAKKWDEAKQTFETTLQRFGNGNPFASDARYGVGVALQNANKYDDAVTAFQAVTAAGTGEVAAKAQLQIGQCRLAQKRYPEAAAAFLVVTYSYDFPALGYAASLEAARAYAEDNKPAEAEKVLKKIVDEAPKDSEWSKAAAERLEKLKK